MSGSLSNNKEVFAIEFLKHPFIRGPILNAAVVLEIEQDVCEKKPRSKIMKTEKNETKFVSQKKCRLGSSPLVRKKLDEK